MTALRKIFVGCGPEMWMSRKAGKKSASSCFSPKDALFALQAHINIYYISDMTQSDFQLSHGAPAHYATATLLSSAAPRPPPPPAPPPAPSTTSARPPAASTSTAPHPAWASSSASASASAAAAAPAPPSPFAAALSGLDAVQAQLVEKKRQSFAPRAAAAGGSSASGSREGRETSSATAPPSRLPVSAVPAVPARPPPPPPSAAAPSPILSQMGSLLGSLETLTAGLKRNSFQGVGDQPLK
jgi:hypothetical protein